jgi:hypothetical protein
MYWSHSVLYKNTFQKLSQYKQDLESQNKKLEAILLGTGEASTGHMKFF